MIINIGENKVDIRQNSNRVWYFERITMANDGIYDVLGLVPAVIFKAELILKDADDGKILVDGEKPKKKKSIG